VCDNVKDLFADAGCNPRCRIYHARTKHIEIDFHLAPVHVDRATFNCVVPKKLGLFSYELQIGSRKHESMYRGLGHLPQYLLWVFRTRL
jgi:hypothetical protein